MASREVNIYVNGKLVGTTDKPEELVNFIREKEEKESSLNIQQLLTMKKVMTFI